MKKLMNNKLIRYFNKTVMGLSFWARYEKLRVSCFKQHQYAIVDFILLLKDIKTTDITTTDKQNLLEGMEELTDEYLYLKEYL